MALLRQMSNDDTLHLMKGLEAHYFLSSTMKTIRWPSAQALVDNGWVDLNPGSDDWRGAEYKISAAGQKLVEAGQ